MSRGLLRRADNAAAPFIYAGAATGVLALAVIAYWAAGIEHWRHDSAFYLNTDERIAILKASGRWVNYLSSGITLWIDPFIAWILSVLLALAGLFLIFQRWLESAAIAALLSVTALLFPGFIAQTMWPVAILPAMAIFLASVVILQRFGWVWLPVSAILLFGSIPYLYFLLPLTVMPLRECARLRDWGRFIGIGVYWGAGLLPAYWVASWANLALVGERGIQLSSYRAPNRVVDVDSFLANVQMYAARFAELMDAWLPTWSFIAVAGAVAALVLVGKYSLPVLQTIGVRAGYAVVVMLSPFLFVLMSGILVQYRSLLPMAAGFLALPFALCHRSAHRVLAVVLAVAVGAPSFYSSQQSIERFAKISHINDANVRRAIPRRGEAYRVAIVDARAFSGYFDGVHEQIGDLPKKRPFFEGLSSPLRITPAFKENGFSNVRMCPPADTGPYAQITPICAGLLEEFFAGQACEDELGQICVVGVDDGRLLLQLRR